VRLSPAPHRSLLRTNKAAEIIREKVQDGVTGEYKDLAYTQCKIVGNGSFGVVFQTKLSPSGEDAAIKRVLQDKRFKVRRAVVSVAPPSISCLDCLTRRTEP
jgi:serine/threonine protein kinase